MLGMQKPNWFKINELGAICDADNILNYQKFQKTAFFHGFTVAVEWQWHDKFWVKSTKFGVGFNVVSKFFSEY